MALGQGVDTFGASWCCIGRCDWSAVLQSERDGSAVRVTGAELWRHLAGSGHSAYLRLPEDARSRPDTLNKRRPHCKQMS